MFNMFKAKGKEKKTKKTIPCLNLCWCDAHILTQEHGSTFTILATVNTNSLTLKKKNSG